MRVNIKRWIFTGLILSILMNALLPNLAAGSSPGTPVLSYQHMDTRVEEKIEAALPLGAAMVDQVIHILRGGQGELRAAQRDLFESFFDPAGTGAIDDEFLQNVGTNYRAIRQTLAANLVVEYEPENKMCRGMRLFYTDFFKVHVCPYIWTEEDTDRLARDLVHEVAHIALLARDRAYYSPSASAYARLSPHGPWTSGLPLVGRIFRELTLQDTLFNPDTYAEFAYALHVLETTGAKAAPETMAAELSPEQISAANSADRLLMGR